MLDLGTEKDARIDGRLRAEPIIWLSTTRPNGRPHLVPVWFEWDGSAILIFSEPDNQKIRNLRHSPYVMLALEARREGEEVVMIEGEAELLDRPSPELVSTGYAEKYARLLAQMGGLTAAAMAARYSQPIRIRPTRIIAWG